MNSQPHAEYQVSRDGKVIGSFTAEQLSSRVKQGSLFATDHYWREGWPEERALSELFAPKPRRVSRKDKMELRHLGIAMVMLLGIGAAGFALFAIIRADRHGSDIEVTADTLSSSQTVPPGESLEQKPSSGAQHATQAAIDQPTEPSVPGTTPTDKQTEELYRKARRLMASSAFAKDVTAAAKIYEGLAEQGHVPSQFEIGRMYDRGNGVPEDAAKSLHWTREAAEHGHAEAQLYLGYKHFWGNGVSKDEAKAVRWWTESAEQNFADAQMLLGDGYRSGTWSLPKDEAKALEWSKKAVESYRKAADQGDADAQHSLGTMFLIAEGERLWHENATYSGVHSDNDKASEWWRRAFESYIKRAAQGDVAADFKIGEMYRYGWGVAKDVESALQWYSKAAGKGLADAKFEIGTIYYAGEGVPKEIEKAMHWYADAAENDPRQQARLGFMFESGFNAPKDAAKAVEWYSKAAAQGHAGAKGDLYRICAEENGIPSDPSKVVEWYQKAADLGNPRAQFKLGVVYHNGSGIPRDTAKAVEWFRKSADQGLAEAQNYLAWMYEKGEGIPKDSAKAVEWYAKAAAQGLAEAQNNLGTMYGNGDGVSKDAAKEVVWYSKAAEQGHANAQCNLGRLYFIGEGVPKDPAKAVEWYRKAAEQGYGQAQFDLGVMYKRGEGVSKDAAKAVEWYSKAAEQGFAQAQNSLGLMYGKGEGVPKDFVRAHYWCHLAGAAGVTQARQILGVIEKEMTPSQIAEAERMAREFKPRKALAQTDNASPTMIMDSRPAAHGTGFFITADGYLVTNHHVVDGATQVRINTGSGIKAARIIRLDKANDLALLKVDGTFSALPIASSRAIALGNTVATVGFPNIQLMGFSPKLAKGDIASLAGIQDDPKYFQISVPVQPGNSGGALVDGAGNVVGVVSAKLSARAALAATGSLPENVNYAVKSSFLLSFLESVPELAGKLPDPHNGDRKFEDVVKDAQQASVLVLVY